MTDVELHIEALTWKGRIFLATRSYATASQSRTTDSTPGRSRRGRSATMSGYLSVLFSLLRLYMAILPPVQKASVIRCGHCCVLVGHYGNSRLLLIGGGYQERESAQA